MSDAKKAGLPNHAQLVSEVRQLAQRVADLEAEVVAKAGDYVDAVATVSIESGCPGCGAPGGAGCADTCAYERKHALRVERYGPDAA